MSAPDVYPVSARLELDLTVANTSFTKEMFRRFCDYIVDEAFTKTNYILKSEEQGMHTCDRFKNLAWHFEVLSREVTFNRLADVEGLLDELNPLRETLRALGYATRKAKVQTDVCLRFQPRELPSRPVAKQPEELKKKGIIVMEPKPGVYNFLEMLEERGFRLLIEDESS